MSVMKAEREIEDAESSSTPKINTEQVRNRSSATSSGMTNSVSFIDDSPSFAGFEAGFDTGYNEQTNYSVPAERRFPD